MVADEFLVRGSAYVKVAGRDEAWYNNLVSVRRGEGAEVDEMEGLRREAEDALARGDAKSPKKGKKKKEKSDRKVKKEEEKAPKEKRRRDSSGSEERAPGQKSLEQELFSEPRWRRALQQ